MRSTHRWVALSLFGSWASLGLSSSYDACPAYSQIHESEVLPKIKSGIPFKLLSVANGRNWEAKKMIRVEYDLWSENVNLSFTQGKEIKNTETSLAMAKDKICELLSANGGNKEPYKIKILFNPLIENGMQMRTKDDSSEKGRFLRIKWDHLEKEIQTEKILIEGSY